MNFEKKSAALRGVGGVFPIVCALLLCMAGCGPEPQLTTGDKLDAFHQAGPVRPEVDVNRLLQSRASYSGDYQLIPGDLLKVEIPSVLRDTTAENAGKSEEYHPHLCRLSEDGTITLPLIGRIEAAGKTLPQLEKTVIDAYYPRYCLTPPSIVARVEEYKTFRVAITGGVANPGVYSLQHDQMSLVSLIMTAGGILEKGAAVISIERPPTAAPQTGTTGARKDPAEDRYVQVQLSFLASGKTQGTLTARDGSGLLHSQYLDMADPRLRRDFVSSLAQACPGVSRAAVTNQLNELARVLAPGAPNDMLADSANTKDSLCVALEATSRPQGNANQRAAALLLPVKGLNVPFADVALEGGAVVEVTALNPEVFTVVGLVKKSGAFPYPPDVQYNLLQALAFAGGVDEVADPRFIRVYRQAADGSLVDATFAINGTSPVGAPAIAIKPGDVVAVEQTPRTHRNLLLAEIFAVRVGANLTGQYQHLQGKGFYRSYDE
ncbi:MAG: SLBB domain-containing protein [Phycisphaerae bacterium]|nr:SLBB domain-containing protein [Phycisphaerae bacterium]